MILDTNSISALFDGNQDLADLLAVERKHHLPVIVIGEYLYGIMNSKKGQPLGNLLQILENESYVLLPDKDTAYHYAAIRHQLKTSGRPIPENDVWIAALAKQYNLVVVSRDKHFDYVDGIQRKDWSPIDETS